MLELRLLSNNKVEGNPKRYQPTQIVGRGRIFFENGVKVGVFPLLHFFTYAYFHTRSSTSEISVGEDTCINSNFTVIADSSGIAIGRRCLIGANVEIIDSDFSSLKLSERHTHAPQKARAVIIGNDVFIAPNVKNMKGVRISGGSVIPNGSVVTREIPENVIAGGNPAKILKAIGT